MIGWFLDLIYGSYRAEFESDFDLCESIRRLSAATSRSVFSALTHQAAVGKVSESRVSLQRVIPFFGNAGKPFFVGEFVVRNGRTIFSGRFTLHWSAKVFMSVWFGFLLLWIAGTTTVAILHPGPNTQMMPLLGLVLLSDQGRHDKRSSSARDGDCIVSG